MIQVPERWRSLSTHPEKLALVPAADPRSAVITYHERLQPLGDLPQLLDAVPWPPGFTLEAVSPPEILATHEGEHAVLVVLTGHVDGRPQELVVGFVYLDAHYARLVAHARDIADARRVRADVRAILLGDTHFLGRSRRRRYLYTPPSGWQGRATTFEARYYS